MTLEEIANAALKLIKPGVYYGVPDPVYRQIPAVSQSMLKSFAACPRSWKHGLPEPESTSLDFGNLFESILIYGDAGWIDRYAILTDEIKSELLAKAQDRQGKKASSKFSNNLTEAKEWHAKQIAEGREVIDEIAIVCAQTAVKRFRREPNIRRFLQYDAAWQVAIVWNDPATGLLCKGLIDWVPIGLPEPHRILIDVKTSAAILGRGPTSAAWKFQRSVRDFGYHWQAASYCWGWNLAREQSGMDPDPRDGWCFTVVGNKKPWPAACYELLEHDREEALKEYQEALKLWQRCNETDEWPGLTDDGIMPLPQLYK